MDLENYVKKCQKSGIVCSGIVEPLHTCPYKVEMDDDFNKCNCCKNCTRDCLEET